MVSGLEDCIMNANPREKIIVALDVDSIESAAALAKELGPHVGALKVGLELINNCGAPQVVSELKASGTNIFFDGKFMDIPNTVAGASRAVARMGVWMFNVHCMGGLKMMEAAIEAAESASKESGVIRPLVLGVTILTSLDVAALNELGFDLEGEDGLKGCVVRLAKLAKSAGLDGVIASPQEVSLIRNACGPDFKIVTPGVRPIWAAKGDQKRVTTPAEAVKMGADYLVIGRPITKPPGQIGTPVDAAIKIAEEL